MKTKWNHLKTLFRNKSMKKLCLISLLIFVVLTVVIYATVNVTSMTREASLMDHHLSAFPQIVNERLKEHEMRDIAYISDYDIRTELGLKIYEGHGETDRKETLEDICSTISATGAARCDKNGKVLESADTDDKTILTVDFIKRLQEFKTLYYAFDTVTGKFYENPRYFIMKPISGTDGEFLIFSFDAKAIVELQTKLGEWDDLLRRLTYGTGYIPYLIYNDNGEVIPYPRAELSEDDISRIEKEVAALYKDSADFAEIEFDKNNPVKVALVTLLGKRKLVVMRSFPDDLNVTLILSKDVSNYVYSTRLGVAAVLMISLLGMLLFMLYAIQRISAPPRAQDEKERLRQARNRTLPGLVVMLTVTICFLIMTMMLETRANTASTTMNQRTVLESEIAYREAVNKTFRTEFPGMIEIRANAIAQLLSDHPELRNRKTLQEFCDIVKTDYLILFDKEGQEICASNSLTGFSVTKDAANPLSSFYPLVQGYHTIVTDPAPNSVTGTVEYSVGSLINDEEGLPDGFVIAVVGAEDYSSMLNSFTPEQTVNRFSTLPDQAMALVDNGTGRFIAHTNPDMIGTPVSSVMNESLLGTAFEGFTRYDGKSAYLSISPMNDKTVIACTQGETSIVSAIETAGIVLMIITVLVLLGGVYYSCAASMISKAVYETDLNEDTSDAKPMLIFANGYGIFMLIFAVTAAIAAGSGHWPGFRFVFDWKWSRGVHLFSLWAVVFTLTVGFYLISLIHKVFDFLDSHSDSKAKTVIRLLDSMFIYTAVILLIGYSLYLFGVNTASLLASAGLVSIAIGMGSKEIISDILAGVFMLLEGSLHVGDRVQVGAWQGVVTDIGIRTTRITNDNGEVKILNNSHISDVVNMSRKEASEA